MSARQLRAVLYARVSTDKGEHDPDRQDPESQLHKLREWARVREWRVVAEEADKVTSDPRRRRRDPPGMVRALRAIEERRADVLAIVAADRLVADPLALINLVTRVQDLGGRIASIEDGKDLDTTDDMSEMAVYMRGFFNRWRLKLGRAATKAGLQRALARGQRLGRPPVGPPLAELAQMDLSNLSALARQLGISRRSLQRRLAALRENPGAEPTAQTEAENGPEPGCA